MRAACRVARALCRAHAAMAPQDGNWCFRLHKDRVYYASEVMVRRAQGVPRDKLAAVGTCFGKFTRSKKFRLEVR